MSNAQIKSTLTQVIAFIKVEALKPPNLRKTIELIGPPSTGKTQSIAQLAKGNMTYLFAPNLDQDVGDAMPYANVEKKQMEYFMIPEFVEVFERAKQNPQRPYIFMIDEPASCNVNIQKKMNDLKDTRTVAGRKLPDNVIIVTAGNSSADSASVGTTASHSIRRNRVFKIWYDPEGMFQYASQQGWHSDVLAYLAMCPTAWYSNTEAGSEEDVRDMLRESSRNNEPYPCSSGWETISNDLKHYEATLESNQERIKQGKKPMPTYEPDIHSYASVVGPERATGFNSLRGYKIPEHADLLNGVAEFPEKPMPKWMTVTMCANKLTAGNSKKTIEVIRNLNPEMVEVFLTIGGEVAKRYLKEQGKKVPHSTRMALLMYPGFRETLFAEGSRYAMALEAQI